MVSWCICSKYSEAAIDCQYSGKYINIFSEIVSWLKILVSSLDNTGKLLVKSLVLREAETSPQKKFIDKDFSEHLSGSWGASAACLSLT